MRTETAGTAGFCFGVQRAVALVEQEAQRGGIVCTLGPIIHNETVTRRLAGMGVTVIDTPEEAPRGARVVIRAHGVPLSVTRRMEALGIPYLDATCPFVAKVHRIVAGVPPDTVVMVAGDPEHPEVKGITGHCRGPFLVAQTGSELEKAVLSLENFHKQSYILVAQTTFNRQEWEKTVFSAKKMCTKLRILK